MNRRSNVRTFPVKQIVAYVVLVVFLSYVLILGLLSFGSQELRSLEDFSPVSKTSKFAPYVYLRTLRNEDIKFETPGRRIIAVGDVHGMNSSLTELLGKVQYSPQTDVLIHTGDILAKSPLPDSLAVLSFMASNNVVGVRGNHDQEVLEWRGWLNRALSRRGGRDWINQLERASRRKKDLKKLKKKAKGWQKVPKKWEVMGDHYQIAKAMTKEQFEYLLSLPLVLHIPHLHTYVVHAGILPLDPRRSITSIKQPLAHVPEAPTHLDLHLDLDIDEGPMSGNKTLALLRGVQERAVLSDVPQNRVAWNLINMRSVLKDNTVIDDKSGRSSAKIWNSIIKRCDGFVHDLEDDDNEDGFENYGDDGEVEADEMDNDMFGNIKATKLPCYPSTIIYGHTASRGLNIKRWSKGIDSGCVYGRRLTALVLSSRGPKDSDPEEIGADSVRVKFGEKGDRIKARVVRVRCPEPEL